MKQTDRLGVHAVEGIVLKELNWIFREQTTSDWGIDAQIEIVDDRGPTGRLIALQIKSGKSFFRKKIGNLVFHGERRHLGYWTRHSLPVLIVLHNPETDETVWQRVNHQDVQSNGYDKWSIEIPRTQLFNADAKDELERGVSDISAQRRIRLSLDLGLMREFAKHDDIYLRIEEWPNKSLGIRGMEVFFEEIEGKPDYTFGIFVPDHNIGRFMEHYWPWLNFEYVNEPDLSGFSEATNHDLNVTINEVGQAFLTLEDYFENSLSESQGLGFGEIPEEMMMAVEEYEEPDDEEDEDTSNVDLKDMPF